MDLQTRNSMLVEVVLAEISPGFAGGPGGGGDGKVNESGKDGRQGLGGWRWRRRWIPTIKSWR